MDTQRFLAGLAVTTILSGCTVGPNYQPPQTEAPTTWSGVKPADPATTQPAGPTTQPANVAMWWKTLSDPTLDSLLERAVESNLDLRVATARVVEARAQRGVVAADLWPQVDLSASYRYSGGSRNTGRPSSGQTGLGGQVRNAAINSVARSVAAGQGINPAGVAVDAANQALATIGNNRLNDEGKTPRDQNLFQAGFDASWELDVFGGNRRAVEAADADLAAVEESRRDVLVTLLSEVALDYVQLRGAQRRLAIARENIVAQKDTADVTTERKVAGFASDLEVAQAQTQLATTQSQVPLLETEIRQLIYQLSVLLAQPPAALLEELEKEAPIPANPPTVPIGLPSDLLRRRPDIRSAERQIAAATARIGVATADLFPKFTLTGSFGPQSRDINHLLDRSSLAWSVGPGVSWPVFDGWRIRSNIAVQDARQLQAVATYEKIVLTAFQEVESALVAYTKEQVRYRSLAAAVEASKRAAGLSNDLYTAGKTNFLNVLDSQRALYAAQDQFVQSETAVITNLIALYKALGGGWQQPEP